MGTLAMVLASKGIQSHSDVYQAKVTGDIEDVNGVLNPAAPSAKVAFHKPY